MKLNTRQREVIKETAKYSLRLAWSQMKEFNRDNNARARRAVQSKKLTTLFN